MRVNNAAFNVRHGFLLVSFALVAALATGVASAGKKVTVCHIPPGAPANAQTISIGEAAVSAHLAHGDGLGACPAGCANASACDDGNACTSDTCAANGACAHAPVNCDDGNRCTRDLCDEGAGCLAIPDDGASCDDGNACTGTDACVGGTCRGSAISGCCIADGDCDDAAPCTVDACRDGSCTNVPADCAVTDKCLVGFCDAAGACATTPVSCDDSNVCTDDRCDPVTGCSHVVTSNPPEAKEVSCDDDADNDCDGNIDAADPDCFVCGDGVLQPGEECDDGNTNPFDGCDQCILVDINPG